MSIYEVLVLLVLASVGGFAYYLYRQDTRSPVPGETPPQHSAGQRMFERFPLRTDRKRSNPHLLDRN
jgi:hypothetical protein